MRIVRVTAFVVGIVVLSYGSTANADIITNGGFDTGDLTGWTTEGTVWATDLEVSRDFLDPPLHQAPTSGFWGPAGGSNFASLWSIGGDKMNPVTLSQTFETRNVGLVLKFDYFYDFGDVKPFHDPARIWVADSFFDVLFEMTVNDPNPPEGPETGLGDDVNIDWTPVSVVLPTAGWYTVGFEIYDGVGVFESFLGVDNVSVVPLPGALLLGALGLGSAGGLLRRLRQGSRV